MKQKKRLAKTKIRNWHMWEQVRLDTLADNEKFRRSLLLTSPEYRVDKKMTVLLYRIICTSKGSKRTYQFNPKLWVWVKKDRVMPKQTKIKPLSDEHMRLEARKSKAKERLRKSIQSKVPIKKQIQKAKNKLKNITEKDRDAIARIHRRPYIYNDKQKASIRKTGRSTY